MLCSSVKGFAEWIAAAPRILKSCEFAVLLDVATNSGLLSIWAGSPVRLNCLVRSAAEWLEVDAEYGLSRVHFELSRFTFASQRTLVIPDAIIKTGK